MKMTALKCLKCGDIVYSRANHDCHFCSCRAVMVDAGPGYGRAGGEMKNMESVQIEVKATVEDLYNDWAYGKDKFGIIKGKNPMERIKEKIKRNKKNAKSKTNKRRTD